MRLRDVGGPSPDVRTYAASDKLPDNSLVGIELEMENIPVRERDLTYWSVIRDGSLRDSGAEYVLRQPLSGEDVMKSLAELDENMKKHSPSLSFRTSVHVHVDVRDVDFDVIWRIILLYMVYEETLFNYAGEERKDSNYCFPLTGSGTLQDVVSRTVEYYLNNDRAGVARQLHDYTKYAAINLGSMVTHGSLEFRLHRGESRGDRIAAWVRLLLHIKAFAKANSIPLMQLASMARQGDGVPLAKQVFKGDYGLLNEDVITTTAGKGAVISSAMFRSGGIKQCHKEVRKHKQPNARKVYMKRINKTIELMKEAQ